MDHNCSWLTNFYDGLIRMQEICNLRLQVCVCFIVIAKSHKDLSKMCTQLQYVWFFHTVFQSSAKTGTDRLHILLCFEILFSVFSITVWDNEKVNAKVVLLTDINANKMHWKVIVRLNKTFNLWHVLLSAQDSEVLYHLFVPDIDRLFIGCCNNLLQERDQLISKQRCCVLVLWHVCSCKNWWEIVLLLHVLPLRFRIRATSFTRCPQSTVQNSLDGTGWVCHRWLWWDRFHHMHCCVTDEKCGRWACVSGGQWASPLSVDDELHVAVYAPCCQLRGCVSVGWLIIVLGQAYRPWYHQGTGPSWWRGS